MNFQKLTLTYNFSKSLRYKLANIIFIILTTTVYFDNIYAYNHKLSNVQLFRKAQLLYNQNKYQESINILKYLIKKYPEHKPSYFLLGRNFYRLGILKNAGKAFLKGGIEYVNSDNAFEYGISLFYIEKCKLAIKGFSKVPKISNLQDLAHFYTGVCYIKEKNFSQAQKHLILAKNLPSNFIDLKRMYLFEINRIQQRARLGKLPQAYYSPSYTYPIPMTEQPQSTEPQQDIPQAQDKQLTQKPQEIKPQTGFVISLTPKIEYLFSNTQQELHGYANTNINKYGPLAGMYLLPQYYLDPMQNKRQINFSCPTDVKIQNYQSDTNKIQYFQYTGEDDIFAEEITTQSYDKSLSYMLFPKAFIPIGELFSIEGGIKYTETLQEMKFKQRTTEIGPQANLNVEIAPFSIKLSSSFMNYINIYGQTTQNMGLEGNMTINLTESNILNFKITYINTSKPELGYLSNFAQNTTAEGYLKKIWDVFELNLGAKYYRNDPPQGLIIDGIWDQVTGSADFNMPLSFGLKLGIAGEFSQILTYKYTIKSETNTANSLNAKYTHSFFAYNLEAESQNIITIIDINGQKRSIKPYASFYPLEWIYFNGSYKFTQITYVLNTNDEDITRTFKSQTADIIKEASLSIGLSKTF